MSRFIGASSGFYYLSGILPLPILLYVILGDVVAVASVGMLAIALDLAVLGVFFFSQGRSLVSLSSSFRRFIYLTLFVVASTLLSIFWAANSGFSETINQPLYGISFLTGDTFIDGRMTILGFVVVAGQSFIGCLCVLVPREIIQQILINKRGI